LPNCLVDFAGARGARLILVSAAETHCCEGSGL
jgi:hypothetical protein